MVLSNIQLLQKRLSHLNFPASGEQNVKKLAKIVDGIDLTKPPPNVSACEPCTGKQKAQPHNNSIRRGEWPMDLVHSDVKGVI